MKHLNPGQRLVYAAIGGALVGLSSGDHTVDAPYAPDRTHHSPNYNEGRSGDIDLVVLHTTEGSGKGAEAWLTDPRSRVSTHYLIMEDGESVRLVDDADTAWHCRGYNQRSVGIEFAGYHDRLLNPVQIVEGAELMEYLLGQHDLAEDDIKPHSELDPTRRKDPGEANYHALLDAVDMGDTGIAVTIKPGETLSKMARAYGTTVDQLREWNGLEEDHIRAGDRLRVR